MLLIVTMYRRERFLVTRFLHTVTRCQGRDTNAFDGIRDATLAKSLPSIRTKRPPATLSTRSIVSRKFDKQVIFRGQGGLYSVLYTGFPIEFRSSVTKLGILFNHPLEQILNKQFPFRAFVDSVAYHFGPVKAPLTVGLARRG